MIRVWRTLSRAERQLSEQTAKLPGVADRVVLRCTPNAVLNLVERFDRRGIEPFELFTSEFGQDSVRILEILLDLIRNPKIQEINIQIMFHIF